MNTTTLQSLGYKQVTDYPNYWINNNGRLYSTKRRRLLKPRDNGTGYLKYTLCNDGANKTVYAHRLVYETFVAKIPNNMEINHLNFDTKCNYLSNLECVTRSQNLQYSVDAGRKHYKGEKGPNAKLTLEQVKEIRSQYSEGNTTYKELSEQFNITTMQISYIVRNLQWVE